MKASVLEKKTSKNIGPNIEVIRNKLPECDGFGEVSGVEVEETITFAFKRKNSVGPEPYATIHSRGKMEPKKW